MGLLDWLFEPDKEKRKRIFISFASEDIEYRNHLVDQAKKSNSPFDLIDMSAKKPWKQSEWKDRCRTKIKNHEKIALISKRTHLVGGARLEIKCALEEKIPTISRQIKWNDKGANPKN